MRFGALVCLRFRFGVICGIFCLFWFICMVKVWFILMLSLLIFFWGFGVVVNWVILGCWWSWVRLESVRFRREIFVIWYLSCCRVFTGRRRTCLGEGWDVGSFWWGGEEGGLVERGKIILG